jgi:hypothetical protein
VKQDPLPPLAAGRSNTIVIEGHQAKPAPPREPAIPLEIAFERDPVNEIVVDENARIRHRLVSDAAKELRSGSANRDGIVHTPRGCVDVRVGKMSISRALRIQQALFVALEKRGYGISIKEVICWRVDRESSTVASLG